MNDMLASVLENPDKVGELPSEAIPALMAQLAALQSALAARMLAAPTAFPATESKAEADVLLTAEQVAPILNVSPRWLYRHSKQLPFTRRLSRKALRFSEAGIKRWQAVKKS